MRRKQPCLNQQSWQRIKTLEQTICAGVVVSDWILLSIYSSAVVRSGIKTGIPTMAEGTNIS